MPISTSLSRIGRHEFFAIMAPGFYIVFSTLFVFGAIVCNGNLEIMGQKIQAIQEITGLYWILAIAMVFLCYIFGSVARAMAVSTADGICKLLFGWRMKFRKSRSGQFGRMIYRGRFPYWHLMDYQLKLLQEQGIAKDFYLPEKVGTIMFNYWKLKVCNENTDVFSFTQDVEARVRLFVGMFWGGFWGVLMGVIGIVWFLNVNHSCFIPMLAIFVISAVFTIIFGLRLRFVRADEVAHVFLAFLVTQNLTNNSILQISKD